MGPVGTGDWGLGLGLDNSILSLSGYLVWDPLPKNTTTKNTTTLVIKTENNTKRAVKPGETPMFV